MQECRKRDAETLYLTPDVTYRSRSQYASRENRALCLNRGGDGIPFLTTNKRKQTKNLAGRDFTRISAYACKRYSVETPVNSNCTLSTFFF